MIDIGVLAVLQAVAEFQLVAHVVVEGADISRADRRGLRIVFGILRHRIECGAGEAAVQSARGDITACLEFVLEHATGDAQIGLDQIVDRQTGVLVQPLRHRLGLRLAQPRTRHQRLRIIAQRVLLHLLQKGLQRGRLLRQFVVIERRRGEGRQGQLVRQIDARIELGTIDAGIETEDL